jgi:hypothetical protein
VRGISLPTSMTANYIDTDPMITLSLLADPFIYQYSMT